MHYANVLLVDDDKAYGMLVPDVLEAEGHIVDVAETVAAARAYIARVAGGEAVCHAVIMDFHLNDGDARRDDENAHVVLTDIREHLGPDFPVIGFSGRSMETHGITDIFADATKDQALDLGDIISTIPDMQ